MPVMQGRSVLGETRQFLETLEMLERYVDGASVFPGMTCAEWQDFHARLVWLVTDVTHLRSTLERLSVGRDTLEPFAQCVPPGED